ncbi:hypothetical protein ACXR2U_04705 [Jatrophihabitans sp. YIM 134969]
MTDAPARPGPSTPSPLAPAAGVTALVAVAAWVLALIRPWGDTGVGRAAALSDATPVAHVVAVGVAALAAVVTVVLVRRRPARVALIAGVVLTAVGAVALVAVLAVTTAQVFPRDAGWWAIVSTVATTVTGALLVAATLAPVRHTRADLLTLAVAVVVPVALVVTGAVVAPGWAGHVVDGSSPSTFSESPGPATVTRVAWRQDFGPGSTSAVLGGRVVVAEETNDSGRCRLDVRALDAGTGDAVWSSARTTRCNGPTLAALDGNNSIVRVTLRGPRYGGDARTGPATYLYLGTEDGRILQPSSALDAVRWWTEGFGLVTDGDSVRGLDATTGVTIWTRPLPRCRDGSNAAVQLPPAPEPGRLVARTPYDPLTAVPGSMQAAGVGNDVVLALDCDGLPSVWLVDAINGPSNDRVVALPAERTAGPTTFLPWLDTVVAVVPTAAATSSLHPATVYGVTVATGRVAWAQTLGDLTSIDVSPVDGRVSVSRMDGTGQTVVLDVHSGSVLATSPNTLPSATVALTQARLEFGTAGLSVEDAKNGTSALPLQDCATVGGDGSALALAGPGGVAVRCGNAPFGPGSLVVGLVP